MSDIDTHAPHFQPRQKKARRWPGVVLLCGAVLGCALFVYLVGQIAAP